MSKNTVRIVLSIFVVAGFVGAGAAQAAGPLFTTDGNNPEPLRWDTSSPIPVYTDGGGAFTFDFDGVTPFITIERANEITQFAFDQWNNVSTSTFEANVVGTIESQIGIADVTGANAAEIYTQQNGFGFWVLYDTDGDILEDFFGVPRTAVLGIAFPELADGNGTIVEATALVNGWNVNVNDPMGNQVAGVFTHEFGHAINLSHTQVNGQLAYFSFPFRPFFPGVPGCGVDPVHRWNTPPFAGNPADPAIIETMYPFIDHFNQPGIEQSTVEHPDDVAGISDLYPTADYATSRGSIKGVLRLKDGRTEYSGINVVARNVNDPLFDAVSGMTGGATQGKIGPDGRFTINNLMPGEEYILYIEQIVSGGFPTTPQMLISVAEHWNAAEDSSPLVDDPCEATPIVAAAGVTQTADLVFNGFPKGVQFTPVVSAFMLDISKSGRKASGFAGQTAFVWDRNKGFTVLPPEFGASANGSMDRNGGKVLVLTDPDGNGIQELALWSETKVTLLGDLEGNGDTCGGSGSSGVISASGWALDAGGKKAVGLAYIDRDGDGSCQGSFDNEIVGFVWDAKDGMRELDGSNLASTPQFIRAQNISGNGEVIVGIAGFGTAVAWVEEGELINLRELVGATDATAINHDGSRVALSTDNGNVLWNAHLGTGPEAFTNIGSLRWCVDLPFIFFGNDFCALLGEDGVTENFGPVPLLMFDMTDDGSVIIGRAGSFFQGFAGALWIEDIGWMTFESFFAKQGVVEASTVPFDNPIGLSASGSEMVGGIAGAIFSWFIEADQVYVCESGESVLTGFPNGLREKVAAGAEFGRCEFLE